MNELELSAKNCDISEITFAVIVKFRQNPTAKKIRLQLTNCYKNKKKTRNEKTTFVELSSGMTWEEIYEKLSYSLFEAKEVEAQC